MFPYKFSTKFYLGILFIATSLILGKITTFIFFWYFNDLSLRWISLIIYIFTWPLLVISIIWVGTEYASTVRKYISYQFYHDKVKNRTQKAFYKTKEMSYAMHQKVKNKLNSIKKNKITKYPCIPIKKDKRNKNKKRFH